MYRRAFLLLTGIGILLCGIAGCFVPVPPPAVPNPTAQFTITDWEQSYYEYFDEYGYVYIYYNIRNTGGVEIDYYEVWFEVECEDGSVYHEWTNGLNVGVGKTLSDFTLINTADKRAVSVRVSDYELTSY